MSDVEYRADVDGLRAVAVGVVVLYHLGFPLSPGGFVGVDVFFVISGYLITKIIAREIGEDRFTFSRFYARRARRILPALVGMLLGVVVAGWWLLPPSDYVGVGKATLASIGFVSNVWFWRVGGYFDADLKLNPLLHTWSLGVEEQFYLGLPLLLVLVSRFGRPATLLTLLGVAAATFFASALLVERWSDAVFYLSPFRAWELLAGSAVALARPFQIRRRASRELFAWAGIAAILLPSLLYSKQTSFPGLAAVPPVLGTAVLIAAGGAGASSVHRLLQTPAFVSIGLISYSLYLWHWPIIVFAKLGSAWTGDGGWFAVGLLAFCLVVSAASYRWIERPFRTERLSSMRLWIGVTALIGSLLAGVAITTSLGVPRRFDERIVELDRARYAPIPWIGCDHRSPLAGAGSACVLGARNVVPTVLVWGDSHALAWGPALDDALRRLGSAAYFAPGSACPPMFSVRNVSKPRCSARAEQIESLLEDHQGVRTVVMAAAWSAYFSDGGYILEDDLGRGAEGEVATRRLVETVRTLTDAGRSVVLIGPVPGSRADVPRARLLSQLRGTALPTDISLEEYRTANARYFTALEALKSLPRVSLVDVEPWFCDGDGCGYIRDGIPIYRDRMHLSVAGARYFSPQLFASLQSADIPGSRK